MCIKFHNFTQLIHHMLAHTDLHVTVLQFYLLITDIKNAMWHSCKICSELSVMFCEPEYEYVHK